MYISELKMYCPLETVFGAVLEVVVQSHKMGCLLPILILKDHYLLYVTSLRNI